MEDREEVERWKRREKDEETGVDGMEEVREKTYWEEKREQKRKKQKEEEERK